jgi:hypothetical protein
MRNPQAEETVRVRTRGTGGKTMNHECTRRSLLQLLGITIGATAVIPARAPNLDVEQSGDEPIEAVWREVRGQRFEDHEREELRAAFGRRTLRAFLNGARS